MIDKTINIDLPVEFRKQISEIMTDSPTLEYLGDKKYRVHKLRPYSLQRIYQVGMNLMGKEESIDTTKQFMLAILTDLGTCAEIVAIILCNHLFDAENVNSYEDAMSLLTRNDKLIEMMKTKVLCSTSDVAEWSAIILGAFQSMNVNEVFQLRMSVKEFTVSQTNIRKEIAEQLQLWHQAQSEIAETS